MMLYLRAWIDMLSELKFQGMICQERRQCICQDAALCSPPLRDRLSIAVDCASPCTNDAENPPKLYHLWPQKEPTRLHNSGIPCGKVPSNNPRILTATHDPSSIEL